MELKPYQQQVINDLSLFLEQVYFVLWTNKAGSTQYKYFMVYEKKGVDGAYKLEDFLNIIKNI